MNDALYLGIVYSEPYLAHFGIKGQKWGRRRFETESGHLTEAGKDRYLDNEKKCRE